MTVLLCHASQMLIETSPLKKRNYGISVNLEQDLIQSYLAKIQFRKCCVLNGAV